MKLKLDYDICMTAGKDAGNRNMRTNNRTYWNLNDWNIATKTATDLIKHIPHAHAREESRLK